MSCKQDVENYEGMTVGTPGYQAPERITHDPMTRAADIYNAGIIFHGRVADNGGVIIDPARTALR